eukprot:g12264.t1 g12264   contig6:1586247-1587324(-)
MIPTFLNMPPTAIVDETAMPLPPSSTEEYVSLIEQHLIEAKMQLADARSSEDRIRLELTKMKMVVARLCAENAELRRCKVATEEDAVLFSRNNVALANEIRIPTNYGDGASSKLHNFLLPTNDGSTAAEPKMPSNPSCASGIAFLHAGLGQSLEGSSDDGNVASLSSTGRAIKNRPPSCASGVNFMFDLYNSSSSMGNTNNCSLSSLGKRMNELSVPEPSSRSHQKRPRRGHARAQSEVPQFSNDASKERYDGQRNADWSLEARLNAPSAEGGNSNPLNVPSSEGTVASSALFRDIVANASQAAEGSNPLLQDVVIPPDTTNPLLQKLNAM